MIEISSLSIYKGNHYWFTSKNLILEMQRYYKGFRISWLRDKGYATAFIHFDKDPQYKKELLRRFGI